MDTANADERTCHGKSFVTEKVKEKAGCFQTLLLTKPEQGKLFYSQPEFIPAVIRFCSFLL
jgi:hypothetical protein